MEKPRILIFISLCLFIAGCSSTSEDTSASEPSSSESSEESADTESLDTEEEASGNETNADEEEQLASGSNTSTYLLSVKLRPLYANENYDEALDLIEESLEEYPEEAFLYNDKGYVLVELGRPEEAKEALETAIELDETMESAYNNLSYALSDLGEFEEAMDAAQTAIDLNSNTPEQYIAMGNALSMLDRDEEAIPYFEEALEIEPDVDFALYGMGVSLLYLEETEESIVYLEKFLQQHPEDVDALDMLVYAYELTEDYEEALQYADIVLEMDDEANIIYNLDYKGILLAKNDQLDEAEELYEDMLEEHPLDKGVAYYGLAFIDIQRGEIDEGLDKLEEVLEVDPDLIEYAVTDPLFEDILDNERFIELVESYDNSFNEL
ncbi:tetratricopeptide repeat protein [Oceanobacillus timonensis]|uniref:tetratricopeptide repeat protein n=1 Tax=Oceanobacillus timonensis TaxID=1926285 RepID=UPI0009BB7C9E|nr:tetratricopeptide repeat protein [Oceanobacillus timonensis]